MNKHELHNALFSLGMIIKAIRSIGFNVQYVDGSKRAVIGFTGHDIVIAIKSRKVE